MMIMTMKTALTESLMKLEEQNYNINDNNKKGSCLMKYMMSFVIQLGYPERCHNHCFDF